MLEHYAERYRRELFHSQGRCYFSLTREAAPAFFQRKPYAGVFVMLGFHEFYKASGEEWYRDSALDLCTKARAWIGDSSLLGRPQFPALPPASLLAGIYVVLAAARDARFHRRPLGPRKAPLPRECRARPRPPLPLP